MLRPQEDSSQTFTGNWIWKLDIWPKIISFLWLCHHDSVLVKQVIANRGINCDPSYPICKSQNESISHMLRECPFVISLWERVGVPQTLTNTYHLGFLEWLKRNCHYNNQIHVNGIPLSTLFLFTVWELWKHRNSVVFDNAPFNPNLHYTCIRLATIFFFCVSKSHKEKHTIATPMCWQKPPKGWYKLNSNGASQRNPGKPGGGKLIHDFHGNWVKGYMR